MKPGTSRLLSKLTAASALCTAALLAGCATAPPAQTISAPATLVARYTAVPVKIDGILDDQIWQRAATYRMSLGQDKINEGLTFTESGDVQVAWDDTYFYLGIKFEDSDIVERPRNVIDAQWKQRLTSNLRVTLKASNLLDEPFLYEQEANDIVQVQRRYVTGRTFSAGLTWEF